MNYVHSNLCLRVLAHFFSSYSLLFFFFFSCVPHFKDRCFSFVPSHFEAFVLFFFRFLFFFSQLLWLCTTTNRLFWRLTNRTHENSIVKRNSKTFCLGFLYEISSPPIAQKWLFRTESEWNPCHVDCVIAVDLVTLQISVMHFWDHLLQVCVTKYTHTLRQRELHTRAPAQHLRLD